MTYKFGHSSLQQEFSARMSCEDDGNALLSVVVKLFDITLKDWSFVRQ